MLSPTLLNIEHDSSLWLYKYGTIYDILGITELLCIHPQNNNHILFVFCTYLTFANNVLQRSFTHDTQLRMAENAKSVKL